MGVTSRLVHNVLNEADVTLLTPNLPVHARIRKNIIAYCGVLKLDGTGSLCVVLQV